MEFIVASREEVERGIIVRTAYVVISIANPENPRPDVRTPPAFRGAIYLQFHDAEPVDGFTLPPEIRLMTKEDAETIWDFVLRHRDKVGTIVVHCEQGMSRSSAVAAAICKTLGGDERRFFRKYMPNQYVYELLLATAQQELRY